MQFFAGMPCEIARDGRYAASLIKSRAFPDRSGVLAASRQQPRSDPVARTLLTGPDFL